MDEPKVYTQADLNAEFRRGYSRGTEDVWYELAEYRDRAICVAFFVGILCCVAYTLTSLVYWLI